MTPYTKEDLRDIVETEGLGYAIMDYVNPKNIEDKDIRVLWETAKDAMEDLADELELEVW